jgi:hypothetical protein
MKLRKILKSMFEQYCKTFKDVPPPVCSDKKPAAAGFFISRDLGYYYAPEKGVINVSTSYRTRRAGF